MRRQAHNASSKIRVSKRREFLRHAVAAAGVVAWTTPVLLATRPTHAQTSSDWLREWERKVESGERNIVEWQDALAAKRAEALAKKRQDWTWIDYLTEKWRILSTPRSEWPSPGQVVSGPPRG